VSMVPPKAPVPRSHPVATPLALGPYRTPVVETRRPVVASPRRREDPTSPLSWLALWLLLPLVLRVLVGCA
jgi:hypothetical protein